MGFGGKNKIIVLEVDRVRRDTLRSFLAEDGHLTFSFQDEKNCLDNLLAINPDLVVTRSFPNQEADRFVNSVKWMRADLPLLVISDDFALQEFVETVGFNKIGFLRENFDHSEFQQEISRLLNDDASNYASNGCPSPLIVGKSPAMVKIRKMIRALGQLPDPVLIQGEPGCGKELVATAIHSHGVHDGSPFVRVSGEAFFGENPPEGFGNPENPWAWGGAGQDGPFGAQGEGTFFIDEVGCLPRVFQSWLLLLDGAGVKDSSDDRPFPGMRVIVSSSIDLAEAMGRGEFRQDLYHRLSVFKIEIPPLRKRPDDIQPLVDFFSDKYCLSLGKSRFDLPAATQAALRNYSWPGNVRELERMVKRVVILGPADAAIERLCLNSELKDPCPLVGLDEDFFVPADIDYTGDGVGRFQNFSLKRIVRQYIRHTEKRAISEALDATGGNRKKAARQLEISYKSLLNKIKAYNLS
jgi:two-component system response regulator AtoC